MGETKDLDGHSETTASEGLDYNTLAHRFTKVLIFTLLSKIQ